VISSFPIIVQYRKEKRRPTLSYDRGFTVRLILNHCRFKLAKSVLAPRRPIKFFGQCCIHQLSTSNINEMSSTIAQNALHTLLHHCGKALLIDARSEARYSPYARPSPQRCGNHSTLYNHTASLNYTIQAAHPTPHKPPGRHCKLKDPQIDILIAYMISSAHTRRMTFKALAKDPHLNLQCSVNAIKNALHKRGYHRRLARHKPPISEKNRVIRLEFAHEHLHWSEK
jgi:hypothetical protein